MTDIIMDFDRKTRCGIEEAVFCEYKTVNQIQSILELAKQNNKPLLLTRLSLQKYESLPAQWQANIDYKELSSCGVFGKKELQPQTLSSLPSALIAIVSAGTSDAAVCEEIQLTLNYHDIHADLYQDIGVAGLWRLQQQLPKLAKYSIIIAVAGMEAALPTVLSGLIDAPIIAVPTSVGYGVSKGGRVALDSCLSSCASGIMTMNIDNGYGAACAAIKIYRKILSYNSI